MMHNVIYLVGNKASVTIQPFLLLHLNICPEQVCTIEDALKLFSAPETLEGYRTSASGKGRKYELVATITHHGRDPWKGHYTADARHPSGKWVRYDDSSVAQITESKVLHDHAYLLFYKQV
ncbi:ubiquitin carboxyl-terminal hydrolase [Striga asiatica]|uniref:Ubiquitin carboxyl-terminal hydrolase n=1 Tax=Striga asiatica TaxID=4170 RepID=A0A5A7QCN2_STRAF|nr:ubiquitin carboxyl-terminal hydrolase [Striga asiatica]